MTWRIYRWIDRRNHIPFWAKWIWPNVHWCPEMDEMLVMGPYGDCFCNMEGTEGWDDPVSTMLGLLVWAGWIWQLVSLALKFGGAIAWPWWAVLLPLEVGLAIILVCVILALVFILRPRGRR